eukprot:4594348-Pyramimonas_sp.AAC.1
MCGAICLDPRDKASRLKISFTRVFRVDLIGISARGRTHLQEPAHILAQPVAGGDGDNQRCPTSSTQTTSLV